MTNVDKDFMLERYKYVLEQKKFLNKTTLALLAIYQAGLALVVGAHYRLWTALAEERVSEGFASAASDGLLMLLWVLALFSVSMLISGILSWLDYRHAEALMEDEYLGGSRPLPKIGRLFHWYETYVAIAILAITAGFTWFFCMLRSLD
ncbi:hypothetical protein [Coralloluteibacterium stylophorae]|uniref:Uncharacterized protein n=1 Tax=Coralloluteibacterium stylophorae TaxID=1776034 RepID=A0A8J7VYC5_9GAMM|nr:hypothetical protein [Coralloluteibacterium stylophorae]MBS7457364.1 hypothetical protein [Coralloluteibacterium stylophorae]